MTTFTAFMTWLRANVVIPCIACGSWVTNGSVRWDEDRKTWLLACGWCHAIAADAAHLNAMPREARFDA